MKRLEDGARGDANMIPLIIEAVEAYATLGEICERLRGAWGEMRERAGL
jgi:methylmalonyl-CoA mutase N-terminal domain/subunit